MTIHAGINRETAKRFKETADLPISYPEGVL